MTARMQHGMMVDGHLGGYVPGGDPGTFAPVVWTYLIDRFDVSDVLDLGCGDGAAVDWFVEHGVRCIGVDGMRVEHPHVRRHDFTNGPLDLGVEEDGPWRPDLVWSAEFVEHVEACYLPHVLDAMRWGRVVAMTHAWPGQGGYHHVNEQIDSYWIGALNGAGFRLDDDTTAACRTIAHASIRVPPEANYVARSLLVFVRNRP